MNALDMDTYKILIKVFCENAPTSKEEILLLDKSLKKMTIKNNILCEHFCKNTSYT